MKKVYIPLLEKSPEQQDWDIAIQSFSDLYGNAALIFLGYFFLREGEYRWIEYDPIYEDMWKNMIKTRNKEALEKKLQQMVRYVYEKAYCLYVYSAISLYAVNKNVQFVPQKSGWLFLKETFVTEKHWSIRAKKQLTEASASLS